MRMKRTPGTSSEESVVRIRFVHYNTPEEIESLIEVLEKALH